MHGVAALELVGDLAQGALRAGLERGLAGVEEDARQRDDDSALAAARAGELRQLVLQAKTFRIRLLLCDLLTCLVELRLGPLRLLLRARGVGLRLLCGLLRGLRRSLSLFHLLLQRLRFRLGTLPSSGRL